MCKIIIGQFWEILESAAPLYLLLDFCFLAAMFLELDENLFTIKNEGANRVESNFALISV